MRGGGAPAGCAGYTLLLLFVNRGGPRPRAFLSYFRWPIVDYLLVSRSWLHWMPRDQFLFMRMAPLRDISPLLTVVNRSRFPNNQPFCNNFMGQTVHFRTQNSHLLGPFLLADRMRCKAHCEVVVHSHTVINRCRWSSWHLLNITITINRFATTAWGKQCTFAPRIPIC